MEACVNQVGGWLQKRPILNKFTSSVGHRRLLCPAAPLLFHGNCSPPSAQQLLYAWGRSWVAAAPEWSLQSLCCDHLANTASVIGVNRGGRPSQIFGVELRPCRKRLSCDDEEHWGRDDLQPYLSTAVCRDRRLPQVYGMQNIDHHQPCLVCRQREEQITCVKFDVSSLNSFQA